MAALCTVLTALGIGLLGLVAIGFGGLALAATGYLLAYLLAGVPGPLTAEALHERVTETQRATLLSVDSLALQFGGLAGSLGVTRLAEWAGFEYGWLVAAMALLLAAGLTWAARRARPVPAGPAEQRAPAVATG